MAPTENRPSSAKVGGAASPLRQFAGLGYILDPVWATSGPESAKSWPNLAGAFPNMTQIRPDWGGVGRCDSLNQTRFRVDCRTESGILELVPRCQRSSAHGLRAGPQSLKGSSVDLALQTLPNDWSPRPAEGVRILVFDSRASAYLRCRLAGVRRSELGVSEDLLVPVAAGSQLGRSSRRARSCILVFDSRASAARSVECLTTFTGRGRNYSMSLAAPSATITIGSSRASATKLYRLLVLLSLPTQSRTCVCVCMCSGVSYAFVVMCPPLLDSIQLVVCFGVRDPAQASS